MSDLITAPSINTVGGLDAASVFPVTEGAGTTLYQATGADIVAAYGGGGGGGGGGSGGDLIAFNSSVTATASLNISSPIDLADMSVTFTLASAATVIVGATFMAFRTGGSGQVRGTLLVNGTAFQPGGSNNNFYSTYQGENGVFKYWGRWPVALAAGTHTIKIQVSDALSNISTVFYARMIEVRNTAITSGTFRGALVKPNASATANYQSGAMLAFDAETYDTNGFHDNTTNNSRFTIPAGVSKIRIKARLYLDQLSGPAYLQLFKNGSADFDGSCVDLRANNTECTVAIDSPVIDVIAGDYFEIKLSTPSDNTVMVYSQTNLKSWFSIEAVE